MGGGQFTYSKRQNITRGELSRGKLSQGELFRGEFPGLIVLPKDNLPRFIILISIVKGKV